MSNDRRALHEALLGQQQQIEGLRRQAMVQDTLLSYVANLAGVSKQVNAIRRQADAMNPAQPVPDPAGEGPSETTSDAARPEAYDDVRVPGATPGSLTHVPAQSTTTALTPGEALPTSPFNQLLNPQAPIEGTQTHIPNEQTRIETDVRVGDPMNPQIAFPWTAGPNQSNGGMQQTAAVQVHTEQWKNSPNNHQVKDQNGTTIGGLLVSPHGPDGSKVNWFHKPIPGSSNVGASGMAETVEDGAEKVRQAHEQHLGKTAARGQAGTFTVHHPSGWSGHYGGGEYMELSHAHAPGQAVDVINTRSGDRDYGADRSSMPAYTKDQAKKDLHNWVQESGKDTYESAVKPMLGQRPGRTAAKDVSHNFGPDFDRAVQTSRENLDIERKISADPPQGHHIVHTDDGEFRAVPKNFKIAGPDESYPINSGVRGNHVASTDGDGNVTLVGNGKKTSALNSEERMTASIRLARLQIEAGVAENGENDDLVLGQKIASSNRTLDEINTTISTLDGVKKAAARKQARPTSLVPKSASAARSTPSFASGSVPMQVTASTATNDELNDSFI